MTSTLNISNSSIGQERSKEIETFTPGFVRSYRLPQKISAIMSLDILVGATFAFSFHH